MHAQARRQLHRGAEEVAVTLDRLAGGGADADPHRLDGAMRGVPQRRMHVGRTAHGVLGRHEDGYQRVAQVLHLATARAAEHVPYDAVVQVHDLHRRAVAEPEVARRGRRR
jgi:hypothetical protein